MLIVSFELNAFFCLCTGPPVSWLLKILFCSMTISIHTWALDPGSYFGLWKQDPSPSSCVALSFLHMPSAPCTCAGGIFQPLSTEGKWIHQENCSTACPLDASWAKRHITSSLQKSEIKQFQLSSAEARALVYNYQTTFLLNPWFLLLTSHHLFLCF